MAIRSQKVSPQEYEGYINILVRGNTILQNISKKHNISHLVVKDKILSKEFIDLTYLEHASIMQVKSIQNDFLMANIGLCSKVCQKFRWFRDQEGLWSEAVIGLIKAIWTYRDDRWRFSTYACTVIYNHLRKTCIDTYKSPITRKRLQTYSKAKTELQNRLRRRPTVEEIFLFLGWEEKIIASFKRSKIGMNVNMGNIDIYADLRKDRTYKQDGMHLTINYLKNLVNLTPTEKAVLNAKLSKISFVKLAEQKNVSIKRLRYVWRCLKKKLQECKGE